MRCNSIRVVMRKVEGDVDPRQDVRIDVSVMCYSWAVSGSNPVEIDFGRTALLQVGGTKSNGRAARRARRGGQEAQAKRSWPVAGRRRALEMVGWVELGRLRICRRMGIRVQCTAIRA